MGTPSASVNLDMPGRASARDSHVDGGGSPTRLSSGLLSSLLKAKYSLAERGQCGIEAVATLVHHALQQLLTGGNVVDQAHHLPAPHQAVIDGAAFQRVATARSLDQMVDVLELATARAVLDGDHFVGYNVFQHTTAVVQRAKNNIGVALGFADHHLLDVVVYRRLDGGAEARAHVDALGAQCQRRRQTTPIADAARSNHRNFQLFRRSGNQHQPADIVLARVAGALEAIDADDIDAIALR